jgi:hypothetical protein
MNFNIPRQDVFDSKIQVIQLNKQVYIVCSVIEYNDFFCYKGYFVCIKEVSDLSFVCMFWLPMTLLLMSVWCTCVRG